MNIVLNLILFILVLVLAIEVVSLMNRRERLKRCKTVSEKVAEEVNLDKYVSLMAAFVGGIVVLIPFLEIDVGWFFVLELLCLLGVGYAVYYRLRRQWEVLDECIGKRNQGH